MAPQTKQIREVGQVRAKALIVNCASSILSCMLGMYEPELPLLTASIF